MSASPQALPPIPPNIANIAAPQLIGSLLNFCLYGVLVTQVYFYRVSFPQDNQKIKWLVYFVLLFETVQTSLNGVDMFHWFASGFGNIIEFSNPGLTPFYTPMMGSVMALIVQMFFCFRIWVINPSSWWWCFIIAAISATQAVAGFYAGVQAHLENDVAKRASQTVELYLWLIGDALADTIIAITMTVALVRATSRQHRKTNDIVVRLMRLTVETNAVSAGIAILSLILFTVLGNQTYFICPTYVLGKFYANTLLVTFNNRVLMKRTFSLAAYNTTSNTRVQAVPSSQSIPFSAGLTFSNQDETDHITITTQLHTDSDNVISLSAMESGGSTTKPKF